MGGMIAIELAATVPERVRSLTLLVTTRGAYVPHPRMWKPFLGSVLGGSMRCVMELLYPSSILDKPIHGRTDVKSSLTYVEHFQGKKVVVVLDNAPAHSQTEERVEEHEDLVLLRLAPYSPMCNPIEGKYNLYALTYWHYATECFSVLKAKINVDLALSREELVAIRPRGTIVAARMAILERVAKRCIDCMDLRLVNKMALHCQHAVAAAERLENMQYNTWSDGLSRESTLICVFATICSAQVMRLLSNQKFRFHFFSKIRIWLD
jgi:hypothetical protein